MCRYTGMPVYRPVFGNTCKYRFRRYLGCRTGIETGIENRPIFIPRLLPPRSIEHGRTRPRLSNFKRESAEVNKAAATANRNRVLLTAAGRVAAAAMSFHTWAHAAVSFSSAYPRVK